MKLPLQVNVGRSKRVRLLVYHNDDCKKARSEKTERATIFFYFILSFIFVIELYKLMIDGSTTFVLLLCILMYSRMEKHNESDISVDANDDEHFARTQNLHEQHSVFGKYFFDRLSTTFIT